MQCPSASHQIARKCDARCCWHNKRVHPPEVAELGKSSSTMTGVMMISISVERFDTIPLATTGELSFFGARGGRKCSAPNHVMES